MKQFIQVPEGWLVAVEHIVSIFAVAGEPDHASIETVNSSMDIGTLRTSATPKQLLAAIKALNEPSAEFKNIYRTVVKVDNDPEEKEVS